ncbi:MAG: transglutaminase-like domain-containing protein [Microbacteriaceae bacterium]
MTRPRLAAVIVNTLLLWVTIAVASVALWPIYQSDAFVRLVIVSTVAGSAIAVIGAYARWSAAYVMLATLAAFIVLGVPVAVPQEAIAGVLPSWEGLRQLFGGVALGWKQLLTITLPVGDYQALLVPVFLMILVLSAVGLSLAVRSRFGDLAAVAPVILFVVAIAFGPEYATWPIAITLTLLASCLLWLMWRRWYRRRRAIDALAVQASAASGAPVAASDLRIFGVRTVVSAVLILAIAGGAAAVATLTIGPEGRRQVLRSAIQQPFDPRDYPSPLAGFRRYLQDATADTVLFTVSGLPSGGVIRLATLDSYDGVVYAVGSELVDSASGSFTRVPLRYDQSSVLGDQVDVRVKILGYSGVWMPTTGQLESVSFTGDRTAKLRDSFYYNDSGGTGAIVGGLKSGDGYRLKAVEPRQPDSTRVRDLLPGSATVPQLGSLPAELELVLSRYTANSQGSGNKLAAMLDGLRTNGYISHGLSADEPPSRSGHSADRVTQLLTDQRMIGDAEQYAVTAALMARQLGYPARVVFGFAPTADDTTGDAAPVEVRGSDVSAWIEVNTEQFGWVTLDPTPEVREIPEALPEQPTVVSRPQQVIPPQATDTTEQVDDTPLDSAQEDPEMIPPWLTALFAVLRIAGWVLLVAGVLVSPFVSIIAVKWKRRRSRRRAATPLERIRGGWDEYADAVIDFGFEPPRSATRRELAATVGGAKASVLAAVTDRAVFAPASVADDDADKVWRAVDELGSGLAVGRTRWERLRAAISLRSIRGYRAVKTVSAPSRRNQS